jgi:hypothetical protein
MSQSEAATTITEVRTAPGKQTFCPVSEPETPVSDLMLSGVDPNTE